MIPKLCTCTFLMYFQVLKLYFWKQIWKFMCRYFDKFSAKFLAKPIKFCSLRSTICKVGVLYCTTMKVGERIRQIYALMICGYTVFAGMWNDLTGLWVTLLVVSYCDKDFITFKEVAWKFWNSDFFLYFGFFFELKLYYY